jgi:hypothetical protein
MPLSESAQQYLSARGLRYDVDDFHPVLEPYDWYRHCWMGQPRALAHPMQLSLFELSPPIRPTRAPRRTSATQTTASNQPSPRPSVRSTPAGPGYPANARRFHLGDSPAHSSHCDCARSPGCRRTRPTPTPVATGEGPGHAYAVGCPCEPCYRRGREITRRWAAETPPERRYVYVDWESLTSTRADAPRTTPSPDPPALPVTNCDR